MENGNNKFWRVLAIIFTIILIPLIFGSYVYTAQYNSKLVDAIVVNDRIRQTDAKEIVDKLENKTSQINKDVSIKLDVISRDITDIKVSLARLTK